MKKYTIKSVYNTDQFERESGYNYFTTITVYQDKRFGQIEMDVETIYKRFDEKSETWKYTTSNNHISITKQTAIWQLCFEDIENCYRAFHNYAIGYDGSHLNYMIIYLCETDNK